MNYTEQLELEAEARRRELSASLDELRDRFTPGQMVDQLVDYVQEGSGGQFFLNLKRQVVGNPLPVTLIGAGVAWLVMANGRARNGNGRLHYANGRRGNGQHDPGYGVPEHRNAGLRRALGKAGETVSGAGETARETAHDVRARFDETRERMADTAQETVSSVRETARETYDEIYDAASEVYDKASERAGRAAGAVAESIRTLGRGTAGTGHGIAEFCREQPLVVAGIGLAIGAALGAALPATEIEDRMMGDASEGARRKAREIASETIDKAQAVGARVVEAAFDEAEQQGLTKTDEADSNAASRDDSDDGAQATLSGTADVPPGGDTVTVVPDPDPARTSDREPRSG